MEKAGKYLLRGLVMILINLVTVFVMMSFNLIEFEGVTAHADKIWAGAIFAVASAFTMYLSAVVILPKYKQFAPMRSGLFAFLVSAGTTYALSFLMLVMYSQPPYLWTYIVLMTVTLLSLINPMKDTRTEVQKNVTKSF